MEVSYDSQTDALYIMFKGGRVHRSIELDTDIAADVDKNGRLLAIEILRARTWLNQRMFKKFVYDLPKKYAPRESDENFLVKAES